MITAVRYVASSKGIYVFARKIITVLSLIYVVCFFSYLAAYMFIGDRFWPLALLNTFAYIIFIPLVIVLPLAFFIRSRTGIFALLPIVIVLFTWAFPYLKTHPTEFSKNAIRVVTSNTLWNNAQRQYLLQWLRDTDADMIFLQEISVNAVAPLQTLMDIYPYQPVTPESDEWGGNYILSRIPILSFEYIDLGVPNSMQPQRITVRVNGVTFAAYNIHLEWPMNSQRSLKAQISRMSPMLGFAAGYDDSVRNLQIERLVTHLQSEPLPFFMAGDFNTSDQSPSYNHLASTAIDSFREVGNGFGATWPIAEVQRLPSFVPPFIRIDYVFHSSSFRAVSAKPGNPIGSDHLPLLVTLEPIE